MEQPLPVFGSAARTGVLMATALLGRTYPRELSRVLDLPLLSVQRAVNALERERLLSSRIIGRQREVQLNPEYFAHRELAAFLARLTEGQHEITNAVEQLRRRPRRAGKPL